MATGRNRGVAVALCVAVQLILFATSAHGATVPSLISRMSVGASSVPSAPRNVTAARVGNGYVRLTWQPPSSTGGVPIAYYTYDFSTDGGATWSYTNQYAGTGETTQDGLCSPGQSCTYRMRAHIEAGDGAYSARVTAANNTASAPQNFAASRVGNGYVRLSWQPPANTGGLPVSYYTYDFSADGGASWSYINQYAGTGEATQDGLCSPGQSCTYRLHAYTDAGYGTYSPNVTAANNTASAPQSFATNRIGNGYVRLSWQPPSSTGGLPISYYSYDFSTDGGATWSYVNQYAGTGTTTNDGLCSPGQNCTYRLHAYTDAGYGQYTTPTTAANNTASAPQGFTASRVGNGYVQLNWRPPADSGGLPISYYSYDFSTDGGHTWSYVNQYAGSGGGPTSGTYVALGDSFQSGEGAPGGSSGEYIAGTNTNGPPPNHCHRSSAAYPEITQGVPQNLVFVACSGSVVADFYKKQHSPADSAEKKSQLSYLNTTTSLVTLGVGGNNAHFAEIMACFAQPHSSSCESDYESEVQAAFGEMSGKFGANSLSKLYGTIRKDAPNAQVYVLGYPRFFTPVPTTSCGTGVPFQSFTVTDQEWINEKIAEMNLIIRNAAASAGINYVDVYEAFQGHELCSSEPYMNSAKVSSDQFVRAESYHPNVQGQRTFAEGLERTLQTNGGAATDGLCSPGQSCTYRLHAYTDAGYGAYTSPVTAPNKTATAPRKFTATRVGNGYVRLAWLPPTNTGSLPISYYTYDFSTDGGATWSYVNQYAGTGTSTNDGLCSPGQSCTYRLHVYTDAGYGAYTPNVTAANNTASPPRTFTAVRGGGGYVLLSWQAPTETGGLPISYYTYDFSTDGGATWSYVNQYGGTGTKTEDGLCPSGQSCTYRVRAYTDAGYGAFSNLATAG